MQRSPVSGDLLRIVIDRIDHWPRVPKPASEKVSAESIQLDEFGLNLRLACRTTSPPPRSPLPISKYIALAQRCVVCHLIAGERTLAQFLWCADPGLIAYLIRTGRAWLRVF